MCSNGRCSVALLAPSPYMEFRPVPAQAIPSHNLGQPAFHPPTPLIVAALCLMADLDGTLESRIVIVTQKDVDRLLPVAQPFLALHHHSPTDLGVIPLLAVHALPPFFLSSVLRNR